MNTIDALNSRYCCRAFKPDPVSRETVLSILEAATRAPSRANTQPWEIYVATGEVLERLRQAYLKNLQEEVAGHPDLPRPPSWPLALQKRTEDLMARRSQLLGIARDDSAGRKTMMQANYRFFGAPVVIYLCMDSVVGIRSRIIVSEHHAGSQRQWSGYGGGRHVRRLSRSDPGSSGNP